MAFVKHFSVSLLFLLFNYSSIKAQDSLIIDRVFVHRPSTLTIGLEQDILPYVLKGYIITGWIGRDFFRYRMSYAQAETPGFTHNENIHKDRVNAFGLSFEFFFKEKYKGLWFGPGVGYWTNYIQADDGTKGKNESVIFSLGGGYNYYLTRWLYVSPWVAMHFRVSGYDKINIGTTMYTPAIFTPEVSLKMGIKIPSR